MIPEFQRLTIPEFTAVVRLLPLSGILKVSSNNFVYLDVDDRYIHQLFPLLHATNAKMPDYFGENGVGAHITVVYPEEDRKIRKNDIGQLHHFQIKDFLAIDIGEKKYYAVFIEASSLVQLRKKYLLPDLLNFKGCSVGFHVTVGVIDGCVS